MSLRRGVSIQWGAAFALLVACSGAHSVRPPLSSGSLALSSDEALIYAVDADNGVLAVVDAASLTKLADVSVGSSPQRVVVASDDTVFVSNGGDRSVSVIHRGTWSEAARIPAGVEPTGMAVSPDSKTLYVVNAASLSDPSFGTLMAFDTASLQMKWEAAVGEEPRGIALLDTHTAAVTLLKQGDLVLVDLVRGAVSSAGTDLYAQVNQLPSGPVGLPAPNDPIAAAILPTVHPRAMTEIAVSPRDGRIHAAVTWSSEAVIEETDGGAADAGASGYGSGSCNTVAVPGVATFTSDGRHASLNTMIGCLNSGGSAPSSRLVSPGAAIQGPSALVVDPTGTWVFVTNRMSNNVAIAAALPDAPQDPGASVFSLVDVGQGPTGIALQRDGHRAFVYNSFSHSLSVLAADGSGGIAVSAEIPLAADVLPPDVVAGRTLFFSAVDARMTAATTGIACATCHLDGREDGHVWRFSEGPRRTPSLAGRMISATAPFHWSGQFATVSDFLADTVQQRMGGTGATDVMARQLTAYIDSLPAPDNPAHTGTPTARQVRGAQVFQSAGCAACHSGVAFTNNGFANVGTLVAGPVPDDVTRLPNGLNVPSLLSLARAAPYLHDGSAASYMDRLRMNQGANLHGTTSNLTDSQLEDLVDYLQSL